MLAVPPEVNEAYELTYLQSWRAGILERVQTVLNNTLDCSSTTLDDILQQANVSSNNYHEALAMNVQGRSLVLQRRPCDLNINNYNPTCLSAWKANMDVQPVLDVYACIMYIVSYVTKDEREMGEVLRVAKKEQMREMHA